MKHDVWAPKSCGKRPSSGLVVAIFALVISASTGIQGVSSLLFHLKHQRCLFLPCRAPITRC